MSDKIQKLLNIVGSAAGHVLAVEQVVAQSGLSKATVIGCVASLKKSGFATYEDGHLKLTEQGIKQLTVPTAPKAVEVATTTQVKAVDQVAKKRGRQPDPNSKRAIADALLAANPNMRHKDKVVMLMEKAGCTQQGANTYIYNFGVKMKAAAAKAE